MAVAKEEAEAKAEEIFKEFREHSVAEFFKKNRQMLGYSGKIRSLTTIIHEYVTNSLDACEEAGVLPDVHVKIEQLGVDHYKATVKDNGPGIPREHVGKVFAQMLAGTKFHRFIQSRGQQGIGASGCTLYAQITTGKPINVKTSTEKGKKGHEFDILFDIKKNQPQMLAEKDFTADFKGTVVTGEFKDVTFNWSEYGPGEYLRRTAIANPHAKITFVSPDGQKQVYDRATTIIPKKPKASLPHPTGITVDDMVDYAHSSKERTIKTFLVKSFDRMSDAKAKEIEVLTSVDFQRKPQSIQWKEAEEIVEAIKKVKFLAPMTSMLQPIGEKQIEKAILNVLEPQFHAVVTRDPSVFRGGVPFVIEAGLAYGGKAGKVSGEGEEAQKSAEIMRFANRSPLLFDTGACVLTKAVNDVDWKRYGFRIDEVPITIVLNITSTYVPYTSAGKQAIADEEEIKKEVMLALQDVGRRIGSEISSQRRRYEKAERRNVLLRYAPIVAESVAALTGEKKEKIEKPLLAMINKKYESGELEKIQTAEAAQAKGKESTFEEE
jgi:DNA topoisomerase-6 subunit B